MECPARMGDLFQARDIRFRQLHLESLTYELFKVSQPKKLSTEKLLLFFNFRYSNGVPFWSNVVYKRVRVWNSGRSIPVEKIVECRGVGVGCSILTVVIFLLIF